MTLKTLSRAVEDVNVDSPISWKHKVKFLNIWEI